MLFGCFTVNISLTVDNLYRNHHIAIPPYTHELDVAVFRFLFNLIFGSQICTLWRYRIIVSDLSGINHAIFDHIVPRKKCVVKDKGLFNFSNHAVVKVSVTLMFSSPADQGLLLQEEMDETENVGTEGPEALDTTGARGQGAHLHPRGGSTAFHLTVARARVGLGAPRLRSVGMLSTMDQTTTGAP